MKNTFRSALFAVLALTLLTVPTYAQQSVQTTTLSAALALPAQGAPAQLVSLTSGTGVAVGSELFVDQEALYVTQAGSSSTLWYVQRGFDQSVSTAHASGATVYSGPTSGVLGSPFVFGDPPTGTCTYSNEVYSLRINTANGRVWSCLSGVWQNVVDAFVFVGPGSCNSSVSGNSTGTNGFTVLGTAPSIPVVQAQTSNTGTNTHYYTCVIPLPTRLAASRAAYVADVEFYYGVQTTGLGTQVATLASGFMNGKTVFQTIAYPVPGASETATGLAEAARADAGSITITPVVASSNVATTTAGEFYSIKIAPATPFALATDHVQTMFTVSLLNTATSATITNSPGFIAHYRYVNFQ